MSDICEKSLKTIKRNLKTNKAEANLCQLAWGNHMESESEFKVLDFPQNFGGYFDLVIASDVVYLPECIEPLVKSIKYFTKGICCFVNNRIRLDPFTKLIEELFQKYEIEIVKVSDV